MKLPKQKATKKSAFADFGDSTKVGSNLAYHLKTSLSDKYNFVKSGVEVTGFAPAESWMISQIPHFGTPTPSPSYHIFQSLIGRIGLLVGLVVFVGFVYFRSPSPVHAQIPTPAPFIFGTDSSGNFFIKAKVGAGTPTPYPVFSMDQNGNQQTAGAYGGSSQSTIVNQAQYSSFESSCSGAGTGAINSTTNCWYGTGGTFSNDTILTPINGSQSFKAVLASGTETFGPYISNLSTGNYVISLWMRSSTTISSGLTWIMQTADGLTTYCPSSAQNIPISLSATVWTKVVMGCNNPTNTGAGVLKFTNTNVGTINVDQVQVETCGAGCTGPSAYVPNFGTGSLNRGPGLTAPGDFYSYGNAYLATAFGKVGIGTTGPNQKLDVNGVGRFEGGGASNRGDSGSIEFYNNYASSVNVQAQVKGLRGIGDFKAGQLGFFTSAASTGTLSERMTIDEAGNVGIGTASPRAGLEINKYSISQMWNCDSCGTVYHLDLHGNNPVGGVIGWQFDLTNNGTLYTPLAMQNGNVGIGTTGPSQKLHVYGGNIRNEGGGYIFNNANYGNTQNYWYATNSDGSGNGWNYFYTPGGYIALGPANSSYAHIYSNLPFYFNQYATFAAGHADLAENYFVTGNVLRGSLLSIDPTRSKTATASDLSHQAIIGIVSTTPGAVMDTDGGFQIGSKTKNQYENEKAPIALAGTAPTLVTSQNGFIIIGDAIGLSNVAGFGAKAVTFGNIVGKALEKLDASNSCQLASSIDTIVWPKDDGKNSLKPCFRLPDNTLIGKIMLAVAPSWYDPDIYLTDSGNLKIVGDNGDYKLLDKDNSPISRIGAFAEVVSAKVRAGMIEAKKLVVDGVDVGKKLIELTDKVDSQQKEIDSLKSEIEDLKK